jgi:hypothetical protein
MTNISYYEIEYRGEVTKYIQMINEDGTTLSMLKSTWDELEAAKENGTIS